MQRDKARIGGVTSCSQHPDISTKVLKSVLVNLASQTYGIFLIE